MILLFFTLFFRLLPLSDGKYDTDRTCAKKQDNEENDRHDMAAVCAFFVRRNHDGIGFTVRLFFAVFRGRSFLFLRRGIRVSGSRPGVFRPVFFAVRFDG